MRLKHALISRKIRGRAVDGKEAKALSRRRHQDGQLIRLTNGWTCRFYEDFFHDGKRQRRRVQKFLGDFRQLPTQRRAKTAMDGVLAAINNPQLHPVTTQTLAQAAALWIAGCAKRKHKPVKPSVIQNWQSILTNHIVPVLGDTPLSDVRNRAMRTLVDTLSAKELSAATIRNVMLVVKLTVASAVDDDGNQLYPTKWNHRFIDAPTIDPNKQHRPSFTADEVTRICQVATGRLQVAAILFAASGLRVGEMLGLEVKHFDGTAIRIEQEVWHGRVLEPKTPNARRVIDLNPDVAKLLARFIGKRTVGFVLNTRTGTPMGQRNLARAFHKVQRALGIEQRGFHAFRRFRNTYLRNSLCPDGLLKFWMGHAAKDMSDVYDRVRDDRPFRTDVARSVGLGFRLPDSLTATRLTGKKGGDAAVRLAELTGVIGRCESFAERSEPVST
jgi:integrase